MRVRVTVDPFSIWIGNKRKKYKTKDPGSQVLFSPPGKTVQTLGLDKEDSARILRGQLKQTRFILHVSEGKGSRHHLDVWYDFCQTVDEDLLVVIRSRDLFDRVVKEQGAVKAVHIKNARQAEWLASHAPELKAVLYISTSGNSVHFVRMNHLKHIFLGHGDSEKVASCGKQFRLYDEVWTAGQAHIDRFKSVNFDFSSIKFKVVGRPLAPPPNRKLQYGKI